MLKPMEHRNLSRRQPGRREDGATTRQQILEAAGEVFAEKGVAHATGKEIAERAGTNSAAVNYYFGGIEGLYGEVLVEAHHRLLDYDFLKQISDAPGNPQQKLNIFVDGMLRAVLGPNSANWALRVLGREMLYPSKAFPYLLEKEILPKKHIVTGFISEILGVSQDHPAVARCVLGVIAPFALLLTGNTKIVDQAASPSAFLPPYVQVDAVIRHFQCFIAGGLSAVALEINQQHAAEPGSASG